MNKKLDPKDVEIFLLENLDFFKDRESLISELKFNHSSAGTASSLLERQIHRLRDEQKELMDLLSSFMKTASLNEDLFNKSKDLTLNILGSTSNEEITKTVKQAFLEKFNVDVCELSFYENEEIEDLENKTGLSLHKGAIHCGPYAKEKISTIFKNQEVQSMVLSVFISGKKIGILALGSFDRSKYLGDEDTTFIQYIRDIVEKRLVTIGSDA
ncbi:MAG: DUF484 family protein [SAR86 cluster bacterium]|nr:DUF484 family protein [SAR86 cluster bacterium]MDG1948990.1 DUF484 family protein [SAR86 cluster bacterium]MDG2092296.1 DUF484 family protein [SAR86 cluster bacterium]|tara:strand:+ start:2197 stop:2835 length:639 start_codon:yes stop_codon:yes gene_type:complete